jgi:hypothetical protein
MGNDIPEVSLVCMVLMACGINEAVVQAAAIKPMMVTKFIRQFF